MKNTAAIFALSLLSLSISANENVDTDQPQTLPAVQENTYAVSLNGQWDNIDVYTLQADATFGLSELFGASIIANALYVDSDYGSDDLQNVRGAVFMRNPAMGRIEVSYQNIFSSESEDFWGVTAEYYFNSWTIGAYTITDELSDIDNLNLYSNVYFNDNMRIELDVLDATDGSLFKGTFKFQLPEVLGNEWLANVSYGEDVFGDSQVGIGIQFVPSFSGSLKEYYRSYSTNNKSPFIN